MTMPCHGYVRRRARGRTAAAALLPVSALLLIWYSPGAVLAGAALDRTVPPPSVASSEVRAVGRPTGAPAPPAGRSYDRELREALILEKLGEFALARAAYEQLVTDFPHRYEAYHRLGVLEDHHGRHGLAQVWYTRAYRLCSDDPWLLNDLGRCLMDQQKWALAATVLERAVALAPNVPRHRQDLAVARARLRGPADAGPDAAAGWQASATPPSPVGIGAIRQAGQGFPGFTPRR